MRNKVSLEFEDANRLQTVYSESLIKIKKCEETLCLPAVVWSKEFAYLLGLAYFTLWLCACMRALFTHLTELLDWKRTILVHATKVSY